MAKEKKPNVNDIEKLRKILDNPLDPNNTKLISPDDKTIDSVRKRLTRKTPVSQAKFSPTITRISFSLQPTVTIHPRMKSILISPPAAPLPVFEAVPTTKTIPISPPTAPLPEFEPVPTASTPSVAETPFDAEEPLFEVEDLIEIEKVDMSYPEFSAVGSTEEAPSDAPTTVDQELPLWKPVTETKPSEPIVTDEAPSTAEIPEFTRLDSQMIPKETTEKPTVPGHVAKSEGQKLSKRQLRAQKKLEKQKAKEAKHLKKIEQKKLRMEAQQKEKETTRLTPEQSEIRPSYEPPSEEPVPVVEQSPKIKVDVSAFKDIESIDEHIGELLYRNGYFSLDDLRKATIDDLVNIRGIKRKLAKKIKKEIEQKTPLKPAEEFTPIKQRVSSKKLKKEPEDVTEWQSFSVNNSEDVFTPTPATHGKYTLYKKERGKGAKKTTTHFFSKEKPATGTPASLPEGYQIAVNKKTKAPYLKKKK